MYGLSADEPTYTPMAMPLMTTTTKPICTAIPTSPFKFITVPFPSPSYFMLLITPRACTWGKAISFVCRLSVVVVTTKIAISQELGI